MVNGFVFHVLSQVPRAFAAEPVGDSACAQASWNVVEHVRNYYALLVQVASTIADVTAAPSSPSGNGDAVINSELKLLLGMLADRRPKCA